jgi:curved DNA-binding protein
MDYYSILGIPRNASSQDIKHAYRKLAMANHPDRTGGDDTKFKQINEAYSILKNPSSRQQYDNPQPQYNQQHRQQRHPFEDIFGQFNFHQQTNRQPRNRDVNIDCRITFEELFTGKAINIQYRLPSGEIETLDATVPPGIKNGDNVRFGGLGDNSFPQVPRGNLILNIRVSSHPKWTRENDNIITKHNVSVFDLILGTSIKVLTPTGKNFSLTVPKGSKSGTVFSITGQGIPNVNTRRAGNAHIKVEAVVPNIQNEEILEKIKVIKDEIDKLT